MQVESEVVAKGEGGICVIAPNWVGDAVMSSVFLQMLRTRRSASIQIVVVCPEPLVALFEAMPWVHHVIGASFVRGRLQLRKRRELAHVLRQWQFSEAIVLPNSFKSALVPWMAKVALRRGMWGECRLGVLNRRYRFDPQQHPLLVQRYALLAGEPEENMDVDPKNLPVPLLKISETQSQRDELLARLGLRVSVPILTLCPGAEYGPAKQWPAEHFQSVAKHAMAQGWDVWVVGIAKDRDFGTQILQTLSLEQGFNLCGQTSLAEVMRLLLLSSHIISNDSGLMHIAAALQVPVVGLFGSTSPRFTPPLSPKSQVVWNKLDCGPCFKRVCPLEHTDCLRLLTPERVLKLVDFSLAQRS